MRALLRRAEPPFAHPRLAAALLVTVVLGCLPALAVGYQADDWQQEAMWAGVGFVSDAAHAPMEMFTFASPRLDPALRDLGLLPWWAPMDLQTRLWRPLTALTHLLDHTLAPGDSVLAHVQSLVWLGALVLLVRALYVRVHGPSALAGLAAVLYGLDEAHGVPVGWLANRNALVTGVLGVATVLSYARGRAGWRPGRWGGPVLFATALLAGESGLAAVAWIFAWAVCLDAAPVAERVRSLMPYAIVVAGWRWAYGALGYGTHGSGLYLDPGTSPAAFASTLLPRAALLLGDQLLSVPSVVEPFLPPAVAPWMVLGCVCGLGWLGVRMYRLLRGSREAAFWALGMALSVLPVSATFPAARLLTFVGIGGAGLVAMVVARWAWTSDPSEGGRLPPWVAVLVALHLGLAPALLPLQAYGPKLVADTFFNPCDRAFPDHGVADQTVVFVTANELCTADVLPARRATGRESPRAVRILASALYDVDVVGIDAHTLELHIPAGMQSTTADTLFRAADAPLPVGTEVVLPEVTLTVLTHNEQGLVDAVRARFTTPLTDPSLRWFATVDLQAAAFVPPAPGEVIHLARAF